MLYDNKLLKFHGKLQIHWLEPFIVVEVKESRVFEFTQLDGVLLSGCVNGARSLKPFHGSTNSAPN